MSKTKRSLDEGIDLTDPKEQPWGEDDDDKLDEEEEE